jgi:2-polyprenyl-3-methyl-5-hydroxy-6-metoxy-1,4-benzoquinol methylase
MRYTMNNKGIFVPPAGATFGYTDGTQEEDRLAAAILRAKDRSAHSPELLRSSVGWVYKYHLSPQRAHLLRPVRHLLQGKTVLELGAGCGALTRYMGENAGRVVALEGSARRAEIAALRCADLETVTVVNDTIQDMQFPQKFDVVTLIGVLEYARIYDAVSETPELTILRKARDYLKPGGRLLLAIENRLGLKYFAGAPEDHNGKPFFGVHGLYGRGTAVTFGRHELETLLHAAGFDFLTQLVPLPDYKLPVTILHPACCNEQKTAFAIAPLVVHSLAYDQQKPSKKCFSLEAAFLSVVQNLLIQDLCNSLYYIASLADTPPPLRDDILASHYGGERYKEFFKETLFIREADGIRVERRRLDESCANFRGMLRCTAPDSESYRTDGTLFEKLIPIINTSGWTVTDVARWAAPWLNLLFRVSAEHPGKADSARDRAADAANPCLPSSSLDMIPANIFIDDQGAAMPFDCEWSLVDESRIPLKYVAMRGLFITLERFSNVAPPAQGVPVHYIPLIVAILSENNMHINDDDIEYFIVHYIKFINEATAKGRSYKGVLNESLTTRELA